MKLDYIPSTPEYWHVVVNRIPIEGVMVATLFLAIGVLFSSAAIRRAALAVIALCALSAWPVYWLGEESSDRVAAISDDAGEDWIEEHEERAETSMYFFSICGILAIITLIASLKKPKWEPGLTAIASLSCLLSIASGVWVAQAGGKIIHKELRAKASPTHAAE